MPGAIWIIDIQPSIRLLPLNESIYVMLGTVSFAKPNFLIGGLRLLVWILSLPSIVGSYYGIPTWETIGPNGEKLLLVIFSELNGSYGERGGVGVL